MKRVLLVIDVQNEYFTGKLPVTYPQDSFKNILSCIDAAAMANIPAVLIQHIAPEDSKVFAKGSSGADIHPEVLSRPHHSIIVKSLPGSFTKTGLEACLKELSVDTVAICGYMTQMCCDTTARQAFHMGFNVEFISDATGTLNISNYAGSASAESLHNAILVTQAMRFSKVLSTADWTTAIR